jgi:hypothetical protein
MRSASFQGPTRYSDSADALAQRPRWKSPSSYDSDPSFVLAAGTADRPDGFVQHCALVLKERRFTRGRPYGPKLDLSCSFHSPSIDVKIYSESKIPITELS